MNYLRASSLSRLIWEALLCMMTMFATLAVISPSVQAAEYDWRTGEGPDHPPALGFSPNGMDIDPVNGYLFVATVTDVRILDLNGNSTSMTPLVPESAAIFDTALDVKFDGNGHLYVTDKWAIYRFDVSYSGGAYSFSNMIKWSPDTADQVQLQYSIRGIDVYGNDLYVTFTNYNRVLKFNAATFSAASTPIEWSGDLDPDPINSVTLVSPWGLAADNSGVYIGNASVGSRKIIKVKTDGSIKTIEPNGTPFGFALHTDSNLYVAMNRSSTGIVVARYDSDLNFSGEYVLNSPTISSGYVTLDQSGALYVATQSTNGNYNAIWKKTLGSPDNRLNGLTASGVTLSPSPFSPNTEEYTAMAPSNVITTTVTPVLSDNTASVTVNGVSVTSGSPSSEITLNKGVNTIPVVVTAANGAARTYSIKIDRAPYTDATLDGLTISSGTLSGPFSSSTYSYTASVANNVTSVNVTPSANNGRATIKVNNVAATSGSAYGPISLAVGENTITVSVTAEDGTTTADYTIVVTREPSSDATLSALSINPGSLNETFASGTLAYTANVANSVSEITVTPTLSDLTASLTVNGAATVSGSVYGPIPLDVGDNTITVSVTAQDGTTTRDYTVEVTREPSSDATLSALSISSGTLNETFDSSTLAYTANVDNSVTEITVTPTVTNSTASLTVNGAAATSGNPYGPIPLVVGSNTIIVAVTAQDGNTQHVYRIQISRQARESQGSSTPLVTTDDLVTEPQTDNSQTQIILNDIAGHWAEKEIQKAVDEGWVSGYPDGTFRPDHQVTRAEFVHLLAKALKWSESATSSMPSIIDWDNIGLWARSSIVNAIQKGIIDGYEDGSFRPAQPLKRVEMIVIIMRTLGLLDETEQQTAFSDHSDIPSWALPYVADAARKGLVQGLGNNRFEPNVFASRAQTVVMIFRMINKQ